MTITFFLFIPFLISLQAIAENIIADDAIQRLMSFPNVLVTAHQAFFTREALEEITNETLQNIDELLQGYTLLNPAALLV